MRENVFNTGFNSDQSYLINELCHSARHSPEAANRLGFQERAAAFYAANALKRSRRSDRNNTIEYPAVTECVSFDTNFMRELTSITQRDLPDTWGDDSTYVLGDLLSRLSAISRTGLSAMVSLPKAELNAIRSRCTNWGTPDIAKAISLVGGSWDIVNPSPELLKMLHDLAEKDRNLEQKIRLLTFARASQQNISTLLNISKVELQTFTEYYLVDIYAPPGRPRNLNQKQHFGVYKALVELIDLSKVSQVQLDPIDQFVTLCNNTAAEGRCIIQSLPEIMSLEADAALRLDIMKFMKSLNLEF